MATTATPSWRWQQPTLDRLAALTGQESARAASAVAIRAGVSAGAVGGVIACDETECLCYDVVGANACSPFVFAVPDPLLVL
jgi:hypothetical protein